MTTAQSNAMPAAAPPVAPAAPAANMPPLQRPAVAAPLTNVSTVTAIRRPWFTIFSVLAVFVSLVGAFIIYFLNVSTASKITEAEAEIANLTAQLASPPLSEVNEQVQRIQSAAQGYKAALARQFDYSLFVSHLVDVTPKEVLLDNVSVDSTGVVKITGKAPNFEAAGRAKLAFQQSTFLANVVLDSVGLADGKSEVNFALSGSLQKDKLRPQTAQSSSATEPAVGEVIQGQGE